MKAKIITLIALLGCLTSNTIASIRHPVRHELVEEIRQKTDKWTPRPVHENHLRDVSPEQLQKKLGSLV
jgi:hypothetical protein